MTIKNSFPNKQHSPKDFPNMEVSIEVLVTVQLAGMFGSLAIAIHQFWRPMARKALGFLITGTALLDLLQSASGTIVLLRMLSTMANFQWSDGTQTFINRILNDINSFAHKSAFYMAGLVALFAFLLVCRNYTMSRRQSAMALVFSMFYCLIITITTHLMDKLQVDDQIKSTIQIIEIGIDTVYMAAALVNLAWVIATLLVHRKTRRRRFDNTTQFQNHEQKHEKGSVVMLRLCFALMFVNSLFWLSNMILVYYWTFSSAGTKLLHSRRRHPLYVYYLWYWQLVPLRGFVHFLALWTALKWDSIRDLVRRKGNAPAVVVPVVTANTTPLAEADTMMQRSLAFRSPERRRTLEDHVLHVPAFDSTVIAHHSAELEIPERVEESQSQLEVGLSMRSLELYPHIVNQNNQNSQESTLGII
jgi:uncharacterized membrane protein